jgi:hypothetical protein
MALAEQGMNLQYESLHLGEGGAPFTDRSEEGLRSAVTSAYRRQPCEFSRWRLVRIMRIRMEQDLCC